MLIVNIFNCYSITFRRENLRKSTLATITKLHLPSPFDEILKFGQYLQAYHSRFEPYVFLQYKAISQRGSFVSYFVVHSINTARLCPHCLVYHEGYNVIENFSLMSDEKSFNIQNIDF